MKYPDFTAFMRLDHFARKDINFIIRLYTSPLSVPESVFSKKGFFNFWNHRNNSIPASPSKPITSITDTLIILFQLISVNF